MPDKNILMPEFDILGGTKIDPAVVEALLPLSEWNEYYRAVQRWPAKLYGRKVSLTAADILRSARIGKVVANNAALDVPVQEVPPTSREALEERLAKIDVTGEEFHAALLSVKEKELKLAVIILLNQIAHDYRELALKWGLILPDAKFGDRGRMGTDLVDLVVEDFTYKDLIPGDTAISFLVWTRRLLFVR